MVGGLVIEVAEIKEHPDRLFVDVAERSGKKYDTCAIFLVKNKASLAIDIGDSVWWQSGVAYWTPADFRPHDKARCGTDFDIPLARIGYSGVKLKR